MRRQHSRATIEAEILDPHIAATKEDQVVTTKAMVETAPVGLLLVALLVDHAAKNTIEADSQRLAERSAY